MNGELRKITHAEEPDPGIMRVYWLMTGIFIGLLIIYAGKSCTFHHHCRMMDGVVVRDFKYRKACVKIRTTKVLFNSEVW